MCNGTNLGGGINTQINSTWYDIRWEFDYNITNVGNCDFGGYFNIEIEKFDELTATWNYHDNVFSSTHINGQYVYLFKGSSLTGHVVWDDNQEGTFRLYIGLLDGNGELLYNLNNSQPIEHPTQGGMYIDSDKMPRLSIKRTITRPTKYFEPDELFINLTIKALGVAPENIGIFSPHDLIVDDIEGFALEDELVDEILPYSTNMHYWLTGGINGAIDASARTGNKIYLNSSLIDQLNSLSLGNQYHLCYNISANFSPSINRPIDLKSHSSRRYTVGYGEQLIRPGMVQYNTVKSLATQLQQLPEEDVAPPEITDLYCPNGTMGIIVYYGRLKALYDDNEIMQLINYLIEWTDYLQANTGVDSLIYYIDDAFFEHSALNAMGLLEYQQITYYGLADEEARANYLFDLIDPNSIAKGIEEVVTSMAKELGWDYILLIGGVDVIPMRLVPSPMRKFGIICSMFSCEDWTEAEIATDFFYGDLTPESEVGTYNFVQEVQVGRIPGRTIEDMLTLLHAANTTNAGRALVGAYWKGEDSARKLVANWDAVKEDAALFSTDGNFTQAKLLAKLDPSNYT
ncbi:MAG: C25 family cysteine peptidase, partial [Candidatus Helarchaeota archaeon]